jgi:hypothetical protein
MNSQPTRNDDSQNQTQTQSQPQSQLERWRLPPTEAAGTAAGLVAGLAIAWAGYGAALASAPVFAMTASIALVSMVIGQRLAARTIDMVLLLAVAVLAIGLLPLIVAGG